MSNVRFVPKRGAAMKATKTFADQMASSSPIRGSSPEDAETLSPLTSEEESEEPQVKSKGKGKAKEDQKDIGNGKEREQTILKTGVLSPVGRPRVYKTYKDRIKSGPSSARRVSPPLPSNTHSQRHSFTPPSPLTPMTTTPTSSPRKRSAKSTSLSTPSKRQRLSRHNREQEDDSPTHRSVKTQKALSRRLVRTSSQAKLPALGLPQKEPANVAVGSTSHTDDNWSIETLGKLVWVCIDGRGGVVADVDHRDQAYWWPAKITSENATDIPLRITLFKPPSTSESDLEIPCPSVYNIRSRTTPDVRQRFNISNFSSHFVSDVPLPSPPENATATIEARWKLAVEEMGHGDADDEFPTIRTLLRQKPGMLHTDDTEATPRSRSLKEETPRGKDKSRLLSDNAERENWSPPPPDSLLAIPGEHVLAREKKKSREYWPGQILDYIPPSKPSDQGKYVILFLDKKEIAIPRDWFFTSDQDEFATCKMGAYDSWMQETENDEENDDIWQHVTLEERTQSPVPEMPPPTPFSDLSMRQQLAYIKPILTLILNKQYKPARERHDAFMKGGQKRIDICKNAGLRGDLTSTELNELSAYLCQWALRRERFAEAISDDDKRGLLDEKLVSVDTPRIPQSQSETRDPSMKKTNVQHSTFPVGENSVDVDTKTCEDDVQMSSSSPTVEAPPSSFVTTSDSPLTDDESESPQDLPLQVEETANEQASSTSIAEAIRDIPSETSDGPSRQKGCPAYEALSGTERLEYCTNVLLPEAIIQLLLWRSGERTTLGTEPVDKEDELHDRGLDRAKDIDFVHTIQRLRQIKEKKLKTHLRPEMPSTPYQSSPGTRTRPRRSTIMG